MTNSERLEFKNVLKDVIIECLNNDYINFNTLRNKINSDLLKDVLIYLDKENIISGDIENVENENFKVNYEDINDIPMYILNNIWNEFNISVDDLKGKINTESYSGEIISRILDINKYNNDWKYIEEFPPPADKPIIIRICNPNVYNYSDPESGNEYILEDMKLARYFPDEDVFRIEPPFPVFDHSPLSKFEEISDGALVTHWDEVSEEDLDGWNHRFDTIHDLEELTFEAPEGLAEYIYSSLIATSYILDEVNDDDPLKEQVENLSALIGDLANVIKIKKII